MTGARTSAQFHTNQALAVKPGLVAQSINPVPTMRMENANIDARTQCACGAVHLSTSGKPLAKILCACKDCQKISGTGHTALAAFNADNIEVTGTTSSYEIQAASGSNTVRYFCPTCGTPIVATPKRFPDIRIVPIGIFDKSDWYEPNSVIFHRTHKSWDTLPATIARYDTYKDN